MKVKKPSALEPETISMVPSTWQIVDEWRQWSLFIGQGRCAATIKLFHPTGAAPTQHMEKLWWPSSQMPIRRPFCHLPKTWKLLKLPVILITKNSFTVFLNITIIQLSWFLATSSIFCLFFVNLLSRNQGMQIWYGQDWMDRGEEDNSGKTCVDVYACYEWVCPLETLPSIIL